MKRFQKLLTSASIALALGIAAPVAVAGQDSGSQQPAAKAANAQSLQVSDAKLKKFVNVQSDINSIRKNYLPKIESADNKKEAASYQMKAQKEMVNAIQDIGLTVKTYNQIGHAYQSDPSIRKRVNKIAKS